jgi:hypothetical protein
VAQLGARLDGIEEVVGSNPISSTIQGARARVQVEPGRSPPWGVSLLVVFGNQVRPMRDDLFVGFGAA